LDNSYDDKIKKIKEDIEKAKSIRYRAEAKLEHLAKEKDELLEKMKELGVEPEGLDMEIKKLKEDIDILIEKAQNLIPEGYINKLKN
jgi:chromosome segregation ATPase